MLMPGDRGEHRASRLLDLFYLRGEAVSNGFVKGTLGIEINWIDVKLQALAAMLGDDSLSMLAHTNHVSPQLIEDIFLDDWIEHQSVSLAV